ncbi:MAG: type II toxin-antitoxin system RelE/ParE family toxin [Synergistaceae bacterium]|nr:type II toxin-antitoxin system RelE/ParE family toxin [Synergistaceae bacterium]MBR0256192.1 type II toxin-antitoxin system RelE/ParE family toxin [Synergistaceae bacterium]
MRYSADYSQKALKQLRRLDKPVRTRIHNWVIEHLEGCENPRLFGKALTGNWSGYWRYRVGDYRLIAEIHDDKILILITEVGHRKDVYED